MNNIPAALKLVLRGLAGEAERIGHLHPEQLAVIYEQGWFNLFVPRAYGGLELSLPEGLRIEEELARLDGSLGWTVTLCSGANWFVGFLRPEVARKLFADRRVCLAGSGRADGVARVIGGGEDAGGESAGGEDAGGEDATGSGGGVLYEVTGSWKYATGAPHATAFTANCRIEKDGVLLENEDGSPVVRAFLFLREEVRIEEDWEVMGMIATASHSFGVRGLRVGEERCFRIDGRAAYLPQPIYQYPFQAFAEATLAVNYSGMAARFFELWKSDGHPIQGGAGSPMEGGAGGPTEEEAGERLRIARESLYAAVQASWEECVRGREVPKELLTAVGELSRRLAGESRRLVDGVYPHCGLGAARPAAEINRVWRDLHTASLHPLLRGI